MSSRLSRIARPDRPRKGLTTRGTKPGPAQQVKRMARGTGLFRLTADHDLSTADKTCRTCKGQGTIKSDLAQQGRSVLLACKCVSVKHID